jgi:hypothetical protein
VRSTPSGVKNRSAIAFLSFLQDEVREDSDDLMSNTVRVFVDDLDQPRVSQHVVVVDRAHSGVGRIIRLGRRDGLGNAAPPALTASPPPWLNRLSAAHHHADGAPRR